MDKQDVKSRRKLEATISKEVTKMFESILDYTQVAVPNKDTFQVLRSRILRSENDSISRRELSMVDIYPLFHLFWWMFTSRLAFLLLRCRCNVYAMTVTYDDLG